MRENIEPDIETDDEFSVWLDMLPEIDEFPTDDDSVITILLKKSDK
jgi:hypothetical protein